MIVISDLREFKLSGSAVSIGMFDGVHRGHRFVLRQLRERASSVQTPAVVVTFDPHPLATLRPGSCPALLSTLQNRIELLASTRQVDYCLVLRFDRERSTESADDFVRKTLVDMLGMRSLIVGENFACGSGRRGNIEYLRDLGACLGFDVCPVPLLRDEYIGNGVHCSSTETRRLIQQGDIASANAMLDRPHELSGTAAGSNVAACRVADIVLPGVMCSPPAGDYAGAVKKQNVGGPWTAAILQVQERKPQVDVRNVRLLVEKDIDIAPGDAVSVRFLDSARPGVNRAGRAAMVDVR
ncbi:FAD synthetase family protein [Paraburkholderia azotifigens]|uniref:FAD synthetase family protein n=1 Tax=Paraburkholderia azotifigens TaxID=2057004 RepID=UPI00316E09E9